MNKYLSLLFVPIWMGARFLCPHLGMCIYIYIYRERHRDRHTHSRAHRVNNREIGVSDSTCAESNDGCYTGFIPWQEGKRESEGKVPQSAGNDSPDGFSRAHRATHVTGCWGLSQGPVIHVSARFLSIPGSIQGAGPVSCGSGEETIAREGSWETSRQCACCVVAKCEGRQRTPLGESVPLNVFWGNSTHLGFVIGCIV